MKLKDLIWLGLLAFIAFLLIYAPTHAIFVEMTSLHPYMMSFVKFFILATMGELLAIRIVTGTWLLPKGQILRSVIWGFLGMVIALIFQIFAAGVTGAIASGYLPGKNSALAFAFFTSALMNLTFGPSFMAFHRLTDTLIDLKYEGGGSPVTLKSAIERIDWYGFITFVVMKTVPFFWIPAHTIVFLLPPEYRVMAAAFLSIALGGILAMAKRKKTA